MAYDYEAARAYRAADEARDEAQKSRRELATLLSAFNALVQKVNKIADDVSWIRKDLEPKVLDKDGPGPLEKRRPSP